MLSFQKYFLPGLIMGIWITFSSMFPEAKVKRQITSEKGDQIMWSPDTILKWSDFKARPNGQSPFSAESSLQISYGMRIQTVGSKTTVEFTVDCFFEKGDSWVKSDKKSEKLLVHEQVHFDIAEYFARELRKEFKEYSFDMNNYQTKSTALFDKVFKKYQQFQADYDKATQHGIKDDQQAAWKAKVAALLNKTKAYEIRY